MVWDYRSNTRTPGPLGIPGALGGRVPGPLRSGPQSAPGDGGTATQGSDEVPPPPNLGGDGTSDDLNQKVANAAASMVGKHVVGPTGQDYSDKPDDAQCFYLVDVLLKDAGAKSASDIEPVTNSTAQNYKWSAVEIKDLKDVKAGDILQFRDYVTEIDTARKTTTTSTKTVTSGGDKTPQKRGPQHSAIVLANNGDGTFTIVEQHVIDHGTGNESTTVRKNTLYTKNTSRPPRKTSKDGAIIEETDTITVKGGKIWAYRPQQKGAKSAF